MHISVQDPYQPPRSISAPSTRISLAQSNQHLTAISASQTPVSVLDPYQLPTVTSVLDLYQPPTVISAALSHNSIPQPYHPSTVVSAIKRHILPQPYQRWRAVSVSLSRISVPQPCQSPRAASAFQSSILDSLTSGNQTNSGDGDGLVPRHRRKR